MTTSSTEDNYAFYHNAVKAINRRHLIRIADIEHHKITSSLTSMNQLKSQIEAAITQYPEIDPEAFRSCTSFSQIAQSKSVADKVRRHSNPDEWARNRAIKREEDERIAAEKRVNRKKPVVVKLNKKEYAATVLREAIEDLERFDSPPLLRDISDVIVEEMKRLQAEKKVERRFKKYLALTKSK